MSNETFTIQLEQKDLQRLEAVARFKGWKELTISDEISRVIAIAWCEAVISNEIYFDGAGILHKRSSE